MYLGPFSNGESYTYKTYYGVTDKQCSQTNNHFSVGSGCFSVQGRTLTVNISFDDPEIGATEVDYCLSTQSNGCLNTNFGYSPAPLTRPFASTASFNVDLGDTPCDNVSY